MKDFSLKDFAGFMPISKSRRQLLPDSSPSKTKMQQFSTTHRNLLPFATLPKAIRRTRVIWEQRRSRSLQTKLQSPHATRPAPCSLARVCLRIPMRARLASSRKELVSNEETSPKQISLSLAPTRTRHLFLLADFCVGDICPSSGRLSLGERSQCLDAGFHNHHRSWSLARRDCGRRSNVRIRRGRIEANPCGCALRRRHGYRRRELHGLAVSVILP